MSRQLKEGNALNVMEIAENGPTLFKADSLLQKYMNNYWKETIGKGIWHFKLTHYKIKDYDHTVFSCLHKKSCIFIRLYCNFLIAERGGLNARRCDLKLSNKIITLLCWWKIL